jgi:hypothetical protein
MFQTFLNCAEFFIHPIINLYCLSYYLIYTVTTSFVFSPADRRRSCLVRRPLNLMSTALHIQHGRQVSCVVCVGGVIELNAQVAIAITSGYNRVYSRKQTFRSDC